jgi:NADPH:quinone reductase-like Zn-dependent oxidoreductase
MVKRVHQITSGRGAWAAMDAVGGKTLEQVALSVRPRGTVLVYGSLSGALQAKDVTVSMQCVLVSETFSCQCTMGASDWTVHGDRLAIWSGPASE